MPRLIPALTPPGLCLVAIVLVACDVEVSLGHGDAGLDAMAADAPSCDRSDAGACESCVAASCCGEWLGCHDAPGCDCVVACVLAGDGTEAECLGHCGDDLGAHAPTLACAHDHCAALCP